MIRKIIKIDEKKCNGCGLCADACHEGAIQMINGVAKLIRDDYCDGLGDCLPVCPTKAITFEEREALAFDKNAVQANMEQKKTGNQKFCPGTNIKTIKRQIVLKEEEATSMQSQLQQWPVQIKLVPVKAPYFEKANLLIAADCTAYAYRDFHDKFMKRKITLIGCPKLDDGNYAEKLEEIIKQNTIQSLTIIRMEVPCCAGIEHAAIAALKNSGKFIPWQVVTIAIDGNVIEN